MEHHKKLKRLFAYSKNSTCFNCSDRRANCHAYCDKYQAEKTKRAEEKAEVMKICQLGWDWGGIKQTHFINNYKRFKRR